MANYDIGVWESIKSLFKLIFVLPFLIAWDGLKKQYALAKKKLVKRA